MILFLSGTKHFLDVKYTIYLRSVIFWTNKRLSQACSIYKILITSSFFPKWNLFFPLIFSIVSLIIDII